MTIPARSETKTCNLQITSQTLLPLALWLPLGYLLAFCPFNRKCGEASKWWGERSVSMPGCMPMAFSFVCNIRFLLLSSEKSIQSNKWGFSLKWANPNSQFQSQQTTTHSYHSEPAVRNEPASQSNKWGLVCEKRAFHLCCHGHLSYQTKTENCLCLAQQAIMTVKYEEITS